MMKIALLIAGPGISGGNYVVYQHALWAHESGHEVTIAMLSRESPYANPWHPAIQHLSFRHIDDMTDAEYDIAISTYWRTALELHRIEARQYINFVQSIESRFYSESAIEMRALIEAVYALDLPVITEATWIKDYLQSKYGSHCELVRNGIRKDLYRSDGASISKRVPGQLRVLVEGPFGRIKNTARAMAAARKARADEIWLLTTSDIPWYPHTQRIFSNISIDKVPPIYRSCDAIIKLSLVEGMFGPPLEMFHCGGTAVVYDVSGHDEYIVDNKNALVVRMHDEAKAIESIRRLREDTNLLETLKAGALETAAAWPSWQISSSQFMEALERLYSMERYSRDRLVLTSDQLRSKFSEQVIRLPQHQAEVPSTWRTPVSATRRTIRRCRTYVTNVVDSYR